MIFFLTFDFNIFFLSIQLLFISYNYSVNFKY
jgi:hypothetical protein